MQATSRIPRRMSLPDSALGHNSSVASLGVSKAQCIEHPDLPLVSLPPPERRGDAEIVSLSERFEANRGQFEDMLRQIERLIGSLPPTAAMRANNLAQDDALAQRLSSTGRELIKQGEFIMLKWKLESGPLSG